MPTKAEKKYETELARSLYEQRLINVAAQIYARTSLPPAASTRETAMKAAIEQAAQLIGMCRAAASAVDYP